ncbi:MAG TPA: BREX-2 system adenine-specific DNA-methyltransferase PglX [Gammaproteobacteria bacterium]|nr:BREX-2 system adenine-specific DNA-methyltransferase PglX [Gammaproteobacteria bacterium]
MDEPLISGPAGSRLQHARDRLTVYFRDNPTHAEREYLLSLFEELEQLPVMAELLDHRHNPLWQLPVSADGARRLIDFFQKLNPETGDIVHDFTDKGWDTRFLGDLYQDLSESVRKRYALLQTPEFVESFILDYTLEKAKETFGLPGLRLIDPTCGSGHFLLTTFERLFDDWIKREPSTNSRALAQRALDAVYGVDINPYAIAVARFRLLIAAMKASGSVRIKSAPDFHFNLAVGDSLLHGRRHESQGQGIQSDMMDDPIAHVLEVEDKDKLERILGQRYHVVVGNPPYITVKDKALNKAYRDKYPTCHRQYSLGVPFTERFFDLTLSAEKNHPAGHMGMITTNSFMKREFGKKLIEVYLPKKELTHIIDTSGAYIPGHGTPTVILFARNRPPQAEQLRAVLGIRGEPGTPAGAAQGKVWRSITDLLEHPGSENEFVSVVDQERGLYTKHPWSVGGGGASELRQILSSGCKDSLSTLGTDIGFLVITGEDNCLMFPVGRVKAPGVIPTKLIGHGEVVRDWCCDTDQVVVWPYDDLGNELPTNSLKAYWRFLWPFRTPLKNRKAFSVPIEQKGLRWWDLREVYKGRLQSSLTITFPFVATHNHFVLDRGGKVFNRTAPVIKLPAGAGEDEHLALLGLLNSSTACFWGRQTFFPKGGYSDGKWEERLEWDGTKLKGFPVPTPAEPATLELARQLDELSQHQQAFDPAAVLAKNAGNVDLTKALHTAEKQYQETRQQMIVWQEELDWHNYRLYGLMDNDLCYPNTPPKLQLGERAFEIALARRLAAGETETAWFARHGSMPITEIPGHWPADYQALVQRRLEVMENDRWVKLIEQPEYKRRWVQEPWEKRQQRALQDWLLDRLEQLCQPAALQTCAQLADHTRNDAAFQRAAALYQGSDTFDVQSMASKLVAGDNVPQMAAARYKPKAMPKFRAWQETWDKQRAEDAIDARTELDESDPKNLTTEAASALKAREIGDIPLPPKYAAGDFRKPSYWPLRGKLDVPKERFFSMPQCEKDGDSTLVIGWAGLNHLQRAQAIAAWYLDRKEQEGWETERLKPMLVALDELIPWLKQWHNEIDPEFGERMGDYYEGFLLEELRQLDLSRDELLTWEPPAATRRAGRRRRA